MLQLMLIVVVAVVLVVLLLLFSCYLVAETYGHNGDCHAYVHINAAADGSPVQSLPALRLSCGCMEPQTS